MPKAKTPKSKTAAVQVKETVTKGSHLTVYTDADGRTRLEWDDAALMRDVQEALALYESTKLVEQAPYHPGYEDAAMKPAVRAKTAKRTKKQ